MIKHKIYRDSILVLAVLFILSSLVSCGGDDIAEDKTESLPAVLESTSPSDGGDLAADGSITLTFNKNPGNVVASAGTVSGSRKTRTITGPFQIGSLTLTLEWSSGRKSLTLNYNVLPLPDNNVLPLPDTTSPVAPIITIVFKADDFNHFNPDIWSYQLHTDGILKKNVFVAVAYTAVFNDGALDHWDGWGPGWNKWRVEGNTIKRNNLVFIPKDATFSKILPSPFPFGRQERKQINYFSIKILPYVPGWEKYFWNNQFKMIGVSGDGPLFINVGQITPIYTVGNPSKAELFR